MCVEWERTSPTALALPTSLHFEESKQERRIPINSPVKLKRKSVGWPDFTSRPRIRNSVCYFSAAPSADPLLPWLEIGNQVSWRSSRLLNRNVIIPFLSSLPLEGTFSKSVLGERKNDSIHSMRLLFLLPLRKFSMSRSWILLWLCRINATPHRESEKHARTHARNHEHIHAHENIGEGERERETERFIYIQIAHAHTKRFHARTRARARDI